MSPKSIVQQRSAAPAAGQDTGHEIVLGEACPPRGWESENICDIQILTYRMNIRVGDRLVECTLRYRVERCTEDYVLSDLVHSTTLFPGEEVFISTRSRSSISRMVADSSFSAAQVSRSSDRLWMETYQNLATDFSESSAQVLNTSAHSEFSQTSVSGGGGVNILGIVKIGGGAAKVSGEFDSQSSQEFFSELNQHLRSSYHQTNQVARDSSSISLTEVSSHQQKTEVEKEELTVSTRRFKNINSCHTVTHYFWQIAKRQRVRITLVSRTCRAVNEHANTAVTMKPMVLSLAGNAQVIKDVAVIDNSPRAVAILAAASPFAQPGLGQSITQDQALLQNAIRVPISAFLEAERARAEAVSKAQDIIAALPEVEPFEEVTLIPTEALYVQSELGECALCEPYVVRKHELELERLELENEKLKREIDLLDKTQEYRCCPTGESEAADE